MATEEKQAAIQLVEAQLAEFERRYGIGGAERQAIIPEEIADKYRALVMRRRKLAED